MIYRVEDDAGVHNMVVYTPNTAGFDAAGFEDSSTFFTTPARTQPELVLLEIIRPGEDGLSIVKHAAPAHVATLALQSTVGEGPVIIVVFAK